MTTIVPSSAGTLAIAVMAVFSAVFQLWLASKRREFAWNIWGAAISFSIAVYTLAVFIQFNTPATPLNHLSEHIQYASFLMLIHSIYGFTFAYLEISARRYHRIFGILHTVLLFLLMGTDWVVGEQFVQRRFLLLPGPYIEPRLGPLGAIYLLYVTLAGLFVLHYWIRYKDGAGEAAPLIIAGFCFWAVLGIHDAVCTFNIPSIQFLMEYGFLGFITAIVLVTVKTHVRLYEFSQSSKAILEEQIKERTAALADFNRELQKEIVERQRIEKALRDSESFLENVIESIQDGISVLDTDLTIRHTNSVMRNWYKENMPLIGKKCHDCYHNKNQPCEPCPTLRCIETGKTEFEVVPGLPGSPVEWIELYSYPIFDSESKTITGVVEFVRDITDRRRLETQLAQADRMDSIGRLAGGVAHDFNNILMGIQGRASLMLADIDHGHPFAESLREIESHVNIASELTGQLLGFARGGKYEIKVTDINRLVKGAADMFGRTKRELTIHLHLTENIWPVEVDRNQLTRVLLNIMVNAWEAMPQGGELTLTTENLSLSREFAAVNQLAVVDFVKIAISDTGIGMDADTQKRVFDPFFTTKTRGGGTGLGLASAYGIIQNHNGFIQIESQVEKGTTFIFYLPASDKTISNERRQRHQIVKGNETILLIDDERMVIEVGRKLLEKLGYNVLSARSGQEALQIYAANTDRIACVILDMIMPDLDGGETYDQLKRISADIKVLLSSGYSIDGRATEILKRGCNGFIQKPFNLETLSLKIREVLDGLDSSREHLNLSQE